MVRSSDNLSICKKYRRRRRRSQGVFRPAINGTGVSKKPQDISETGQQDNLLMF
jgi:hypothetical protein